MLHCVSIWPTGHAPHKGRWVYLSTWRRHAHLLEVRRYATRLRSGLAGIMNHAWRHMLSWRHAWMLLGHARVWRESLRGHHFDCRLSTAVDIGQCLSSLSKWHALRGGDRRYRLQRSEAGWGRNTVSQKGNHQSRKKAEVVCRSRVDGVWDEEVGRRVGAGRECA